MSYEEHDEESFGTMLVKDDGKRYSVETDGWLVDKQEGYAILKINLGVLTLSEAYLLGQNLLEFLNAQDEFEKQKGRMN